MERKVKARERSVKKVNQSVWWKEETRSGTAGRDEGRSAGKEESKGGKFNV